MSTSSVPIPLDMFALAIQDLELPFLHTESARLANSIMHLERSNETLKEYPDDRDCQDAITYNVDVIHQQKQRIHLLKLELQRRGIRTDHMDAEVAAQSTTAALVVANSTENVGNDTVHNGSGVNGHTEENGDGVYL